MNTNDTYNLKSSESNTLGSSSPNPSKAHQRANVQSEKSQRDQDYEALENTVTKGLKNVIQMVNERTYYLEARGCVMTLLKEDDLWVMYTVNAAVMAYSNGYPCPKFFNSLKEVSQKYKSWRGIETLTKSTQENI